MFFVAVRRTSRRALRRVGHAGARETGDAYVRALVGYPFRPRTVQPGASAGYHGSMRKPQISLGALFWPPDSLVLHWEAERVSRTILRHDQ